MNALQQAAPRRRFGVAAILAAVLVAAPVLVVLAALAAPKSAALAHVLSTNALVYAEGTFGLVMSVGLGAGLVGGVAATLVALCEFPGRRLLSAALALPFAVPAYVAAYAYADLFSPFGALRSIGFAAPEIHSFGGAAFVLILATYPYVYLATRASLASRSAAFMEAARMLGAAPVEAARRVLWPAGRAAFAGGLALAMMEAAADFGVADFLGVPTLSTGVFRTWYGMGDLAAATQLAALLLLVALLLATLERASRRGAGAESARAARGPARFQLKGFNAAAAVGVCALPPVLGFVAPAGALIALALDGARFESGLAEAAANTAALGAAAALLIMPTALLLAYEQRRGLGVAGSAALGVATIGYAAPGAVLAVGVLSAAGLVAGGSGFAATGVGLLLYAYGARFLAAGFAAASGGLAQIPRQADDAARTLGVGGAAILIRIHATLARPALVAGALVVFIDVAKELPATLLLRGFNFETLATRAHRLAADERLREAAGPSLLLIAAGLIAVVALDQLQHKRSTNGEW